MKKWIIRIVLLGALTAAGYAGYTALQAMTAQRQLSIATAKVRQGDVIVRSFTRGELRAVRSVTLTAPNLFGTVQVTKLAALGAFAREKDLVVEFDDAEVQSRLEEKQLELDQIDEQIKKAQADLAIRDNQDQVELLRARYAVRRAELEVKKNELISAIDAKKNQLTLDESKRRLSQLESDIKSRREQSQAELAVLREKKNKATLEMARERSRLSQVKLLSPISGLVAIKQNRSSVMMFGMQLPDIREGDQVQPGTPVADVLDLSEMEVLAKVGELDRANLREGQQVTIKLDAIAEKQFTGTIKSMSGTASSNMFSGDVQKKFDVIFSVDMKQLLSALGARPDQIAKVLATAEANRKKPPTASSGGGMMAAMMAGGGMPGGMGGMQGGGMPGGMSGGGMPGGGQTMGAPGGAEGGAQRGGGGMFGGANLTPEQQQKVRAATQKALNGKSMQELTPEERTGIMAKVREEVAKLGITLPQRGGGAGGGRGGPGGAPGGMMMPFAGGNGPFSAKDMELAKLPPPPEEDSQVEVLLRPGLLADVEIIIEKIENAVNVPMQAVFEKDGKQVVYVKNGNKFDERVIRPSKRSESTMVIAEGVKPGETVALADPNEKPGDKKKKSEQKPAGGGGAAGMPMPKS
ncbi:MAG: HlyD family efflux transporter periplasmic adaptor subunit [Acidobacteria bacterium]|nr:HlyD family efflux transporter periplasmic adaptor subunit [Acidobacteriota bacterium]